jgi:hypothetical protein
MQYAKGSFLGPFQFVFHTVAVTRISDGHGVSHSLFTDNKQIYDSDVVCVVALSAVDNLNVLVVSLTSQVVCPLL